MATQFDDKQIAGLQRLLSLLEPDTLTKEEFLKQFKGVIEYVKTFESKFGSDFQTLATTLTNKGEEVKTTSASDISSYKDEAKGLIASELARLTTTIDAKLAALDSALAGVKDGIDADPTQVMQDVLAQIQLPEQKEIILDTPEDIRNKLELLQGPERLKASAIDGLDEEIANLKQGLDTARTRPTAGRSLLQLYVNGVKKGAVQYLNITGTGVTYASANGRNDVTITGSSGSLSVLAATGTVNDTNTTFTFASAPTLVIVDGAMYRHGKGVTIVTTTATLDNPVGTGGDIYGLG